MSRPKGFKHSEETKEKITESQKGEKNSFYGKTHSKKNKEKFRKLREGKTYEEIFGVEKAKMIKQKESGKVPWIKGKHHTEETKKKLSINHMGLKNGLGFKHSLTTRKNMSKRMKGSKINLGRKHTEEQKMKSREIAKTNPNHGMKGKSHSKDAIDKIKERRSKQVFPVKDTKIEIKIQNYLTKLGYEFFTHQYMKIEHGYQCDILIPSENLVIECDGDAFHFNPEKYNPEDKIFKNGLTAQEKWDLDHSRTIELEENGYKVLRMWGSEIKALTLEEFKAKVRTIVAPELIR